jgi:LPS sulfotransferase NodH
MTELEKKRKERRKKTAEDFTPDPLVQEMLDKLPQEVWTDPSKTFLDNSAGNGNFLVAILRRKLAAGHSPLQAISTIYGVELMPDNVEEMKDRLLVELPTLTPQEVKKARKIIDHNIVCHDALTWDYENWKSTKPAEAKPLF